MKTFTLTDDEIRFLQACYNDSRNEGHFDPLFAGDAYDENDKWIKVGAKLDVEALETSLATKGLLKSD